MYKKTKTNYGKNMFKYESKHFFFKVKNKNPRYERQKFKWNFIMITYMKT